jgi:hypothetical protein
MTQAQFGESSPFQTFKTFKSFKPFGQSAVGEPLKLAKIKLQIPRPESRRKIAAGKLAT